MYLLYPLQGELEGYSRREFIKDLIGEVSCSASFIVICGLILYMQCEKDIRGCFETGAKRVSIDFTEGRLALKNDPRNPWTNADLLERFILLINQYVEMAHYGL